MQDLSVGTDFFTLNGLYGKPFGFWSNFESKRLPSFVHQTDRTSFRNITFWDWKEQPFLSRALSKRLEVQPNWMEPKISSTTLFFYLYSQFFLKERLKKGLIMIIQRKSEANDCFEETFGLVRLLSCFYVVSSAVSLVHAIKKNAFSFRMINHAREDSFMWKTMRETFEFKVHPELECACW